ncbi:MAG: M23 family metallopeptidase [Oscillospiraceae bacterium]|nr:M23 family metallopeptidase [Oscillospiraceae bacterium]
MANRFNDLYDKLTLGDEKTAEILRKAKEMKQKNSMGAKSVYITLGVTAAAVLLMVFGLPALLKSGIVRQEQYNPFGGEEFAVDGTDEWQVDEDFGESVEVLIDGVPTTVYKNRVTEVEWRRFVDAVEAGVIEFWTEYEGDRYYFIEDVNRIVNERGLHQYQMSERVVHVKAEDGGICDNQYYVIIDGARVCTSCGYIFSGYYLDGQVHKYNYKVVEDTLGMEVFITDIRGVADIMIVNFEITPPADLPETVSLSPHMFLYGDDRNAWSEGEKIFVPGYTEMGGSKYTIKDGVYCWEMFFYSADKNFPVNYETFELVILAYEGDIDGLSMFDRSNWEYFLYGHHTSTFTAIYTADETYEFDFAAENIEVYDGLVMDKITVSDYAITFYFDSSNFEFMNIGNHFDTGDERGYRFKIADKIEGLNISPLTHGATFAYLDPQPDDLTNGAFATFFISHNNTDDVRTIESFIINGVEFALDWGERGMAFPTQALEDGDYMYSRWGEYFLYPSVGEIVTEFGSAGGDSAFYNGIFIASYVGGEVFAALDGEVIFADWNGNYGLCVIIQHEDGLSTLYGHCSELTVSVGDNVRQGKTIAMAGNTGAAEDVGLYFEVRVDDVAVNPRDFIG